MNWELHTHSAINSRECVHCTVPHSCTQMVNLVKDPEGETVMQSGAPDTIQSPTVKFKSSDPNKNHNDDEVIKLRQRLTEMELKLAEVCVHVTHTHCVKLSVYIVHS